MERKICTIGNSQGVTLPKAYIEALGLEIGSQIEIILDTEQEALILCRPKSGQHPQNVSEEFAQRVKRFIDRNRATLEALAR
jgi:antitoxin component of MazEF toxin-antitoxin module